jgi:hypothetical protein
VLVYRGLDLQLAGAGAAEGELNFESRLRADEGVVVVDLADLCTGEFFTDVVYRWVNPRMKGLPRLSRFRVGDDM